MKWTVFDYLYRDAGNHKAFGSIFLGGQLEAIQVEAIRHNLFDGSKFVAEQVGIPTLYDQLYRWTGGPNEDDHCWHEVEQIREIDIVDPSMIHKIFEDASTFHKRIIEIQDWDLSMSPHYYLGNPLQSTLDGYW